MADTIALSIALALPWLTGWAVLATLALLDGVAEKPGDSAWRFGAGWFAGVLLLTSGCAHCRLSVCHLDVGRLAFRWSWWRRR